MATGNFPLLLFPEPTPADRNSLGGGGGSIRVPDIARQRARIAPQLTVLQQAFDAQRLKLQQTAPMENPELILVLEVAGTVEDFAKAVAKIPGMEWLVEWAEDQIAPDEDFFIQGKADKTFPGRLFLLASNQEALSQLLALWTRYQNDPAAQFDRGLNKFRNMFGQLRNIRHWSAADRIDTDVRQYWQNCLDDGLQAIRFEIEAWHFASQQKNDKAREDITALVQGLGGHVLRNALIGEIAYHGFLVELPAQAVAGVLAGETPELVLSDRIMFFRPKAQSITDGVNEAEVEPHAVAVRTSDQPPIVALLDGLPLQNHAQLQGRLLVDDPDGWEGDYAAKDRVHGTAMASLILHGELDGGIEPLRHRLYVRPVLRPDPNDNFNIRRREHTPDDVLLIDLIHRAVKRICEGEGQEPAAAPSVRVINLSIGDEARLFDRQMSPWARLLDWLAFRYSVLFIVSAGNDLRTLSLQTPSHTLDGLTPEQRSALAFTAMTTEHVDRRLLAPAEALNVLTVGALHADQANAPAVPGRYDLFVAGGLSPLSRIGHGFRRAVKPDILMSGGRVLYRARMQPDPAVSVLDVVTAGVAPGHRVAVPPLPGESLAATAYTRGTSNAAALASRAATQAYDMLELLRAAEEGAPGAMYDAVLLKALLVHGAQWGDWPDRLLAEHPELETIAQAGIYKTADHLARLEQAADRDPQATVDVHVRRLEALRRVGVVAHVADGVWQVPQDLVQKVQRLEAQRGAGPTIELRSHLPIEQQVRAMGATWLDRQLIVEGSGVAAQGFGAQVREAMRGRADFLVEQGLAERRGRRMVFSRNLLSTLRDRELATAGKSLQDQTGKTYRSMQEGARASGVYRRSIQLTSGRFAMLDDGIGFSLVPWKQVLEHRLGQQVSAMVRGQGVTWQLGRKCGLSI